MRSPDIPQGRITVAECDQADAMIRLLKQFRRETENVRVRNEIARAVSALAADLLARREEGAVVVRLHGDELSRDTLRALMKQIDEERANGV